MNARFNVEYAAKQYIVIISVIIKQPIQMKFNNDTYQHQEDDMKIEKRSAERTYLVLDTVANDECHIRRRLRYGA